MVEIIRISVQPLTTPNYPDPTPLPRQIRIGDRTATLKAEAALWHALNRIARERGLSIHQLETSENRLLRLKEPKI